MGQKGREIVKMDVDEMNICFSQEVEHEEDPSALGEGLELMLSRGR